MLEPTPFRRQHGRVTQATGTIADSDGSIGLPWLAEGLLGRLERRGAITAAQAHAGHEFHRLFQLAHLDPLKAADLVRGERSGAAGPHGAERAKRRILDALDALGGQGSPCGSCAWFVLGCELSLAGWARREAWSGRTHLSRDVAKGTLLGTLGVLERHFGM